MPRRKKKPGSKQQSKRLRGIRRRSAAAKALGSPLYRQRIVPNKKRDTRTPEQRWAQFQDWCE